MRYFSAFMGGFLAIFAHIYLYAGRGDWFAPQRLAPALGNALIFAHIFALLVYLSHEKRLFWLLRIILCIALGILAWWEHLFFYLYQRNPDILTLLIGGIGLAFGFILAGLIPIENRFLCFGVALIVSTTAIYAPIYWTYQNFLASINSNPAQALLYFQADNPEYAYLIGIPFALCLAFFGNLPLLFSIRENTV
jgi:hypothetical protein